MDRRVRQRISSYLSATLLVTLLSSGVVAPEITAEQASAELVQPAAPNLDLNNECDQNYISTNAGVVIEKIGNDCVIQFRAVGTYTWRVPKGLTNISRLLVVGGGGGGGIRHGGGGGAGGYVYKENVAVNPHSNLSIIVGDGGGRSGEAGYNGGDSLFNNTFRAKGGGGGASNSTQTGRAGGSGGGGTGPTGVGGASNQITSGDAGGLGQTGARGSSNTAPAGSAFWTGGGGGGSSSAGQIGNGATNRGGNGGAGTLNDITGELICYAAGGGGGTNQLGTPGAGGSCLRASDSSVITSGAPGGNNAWGPAFERNLDASPNTGSGGGGGGYTTDVRSELGGAGGRGIVVIRYALQTGSLDLNAANYPGTGTTWPDTSTGKNNGVLQGGPTFVGATTDNPAHFKFDGTKSQYVSTSRFIPSAGPLNFSGGVWFRTTSNQAAKIIGFENTQTGTGTGNYDRHLYIGTDNRLYWAIYDSADQGAKYVRTSQKVNDGKWHYAFFTSTWVYGGRVISLSLDNGPAISLSHPGRNQDYGGWWRIGGYMMNGWPNARTGYFTGDIARATIYSWVLSPEQAREKYLEMYAPIKVNALASTVETGIKASWNAVSGATGYQVNIYNASASALIRSVNVGTALETTLTTAAPFNIAANTGYRISVTPTFSAGARKTFFNESEKSEIVVPNDVLCQPERSISGPYTILQFKTSNTAASTSCRWTAPTLTTPLEYLVIGGGGGGGQNHAAGGQGGFYNAGALTNASGSTVTITVGAGGAGAFNAKNDSRETKLLANAARSGSDGFPSVVTTSERAIVASGGAGGVTTWARLSCFNDTDRVTNEWSPAKPGTTVIGRSGLAGGQGGAPRATAADGVRNRGTVGLQTLVTSFNNVTAYSIGGDSGVWGSDASLGVNGSDHTGNGGQGGGSDCYGGGRGGSGIVILRYLTPLPKAPSPLIVLPETMNTALFARYQASDYNTISKTWRDSSGRGRDIYASRGNPQLQVVKVGTNNAKNDFVAVSGTPNESIPFMALPKNYTLFHVARYSGASKGRIFDGTGTNWLSGFWAGRVGVSFHFDWKTANELADNKNPETDWIVSTDKRNSYRSQGVDRTTKGSGYQFGPLTRFGINDGDRPAERSDFQVAEVIIYNRELNDTEVAQVETYLQRKYTYQNPDIVGNVAGGGWVESQYCPAGQVAVGVKAVRLNYGFSKFQMICHQVAVGGNQTVNSDSLTTRTNIGADNGTPSSIYCNNTGGAQDSVVTGIRFARGNGLGSQDYYVAGLKLICGSLGNVNGPKSESNFFSSNAQPASNTSVSGAFSYYPTPRNPAQCPADQVVVGFNAKSGSVTDAIQIICGILPLPTLNAPVLEPVAATLKTLRATWDTISTASSYTVELFDGAGSTLLETSGLANLSRETNTVLITATNFPGIADSTAYRVRVTANGDGIVTLFGPASALSASATTAAAAAAPTFSDHPKVNNSDSITVAIGSSLIIFETATAAGTLSYQWTKDGTPIPGATTKDLTLNAVTSDSAGAYRVVVTNTLNGSTAKTTSNPFNLDVLEILTPKSGLVRKINTNTPLVLQTRGTKDKTFSFVKGGESLTVGTSGDIRAKDTTTALVVEAQVSVTSNGATHTTDTFTVRYVATNLATPTGVTLAAGNALKSLVARWNAVESATVYTALLYDSASTLLSTRGLDGFVATESGTTRSVVINSTNYGFFRDGETYTVRIIAVDTTGALADSDSSTAALALTALPVASLNLAASVAVSPAGELKITGGSVTFRPTVTGAGTGTLSYQWYRSGLVLVGETGSTLTVSPILNSSAGLYTVEVTNTLFGESVTVMSNGQTISVVDGVKINKPVNGLVATINKPYRLPITTLTGTAPITFELDPTYDDLPTGLRFETSTGLIVDTPTVKGFYPLRVIAKDANNSYDTTTVFTISVVETALATVSPIARATANTLKSIDVEWSAIPSANRYLVRLYEDSATATSGFTPLAEVNGITGTSYTLTASDYVQLEDNTPYKIVVVALDASGNFGDSAESAYTSVRTNTPPTAPTFTTSPVATASGNLGSVISLTSLATSPAGAVTYQWSKDGTAIEGQTGANLVIVSLAERDAGVYSVSATSTLNGISVSTTAETSTTVSVNFSVETPTVGLTGAVGKDYSLGIRTIGGSATKTFAVSSGTLPSGLQINAATGAITGRPDTVTASTPITVKVTSDGTDRFVSFNLNVVIPSKMQITSVTAVPTPGVLKSIRVDWSKFDATVHMVHLYDNGGALLRAFVAYETATGTSLTITSNDFAGLADSTDYKIGIIAVGDVSTANAPESEQITVRTNAAPERPTFIVQPTTVAGAIGSSVTLTSSAVKNDDGILSYQWFKGNDIIPGAISDSFTVTSLAASDITSYSVRATNTLNGATARTTSSTARIEVLSDLKATTPTSGLKIRTGIPYRLSVESTGGAGENTWSVVNGILPTGLTLDSKTALITGTPSESLTVGTVYTVTLQVRDRYNATSNTEPFAITLVDSASVLATPTLTTNTKATLDTTRSISVEWTVVESATSYTVNLYDSAGTLIKTTGLTGLTGSSIASTTINSNNYADIAASTKYLVGVVANYDGALSIGASAESTRKEVTTGSNLTPPPPTPAPTAPPANNNESSGGSVVVPVAPTPQVGPAITIIPGAPFNLQVNAPGANTFAINGGALPAGLTLDPRTGLITGTPTQSGPYSFTILATPPLPGTLITYSGNIVAPPAPTEAPQQTIRPGEPANIQVNVPGANNFTVYGGSLPAGLTIDQRTGLISGTPTQTGPYDFTILATPPAQGTLVRFRGNVEAPAPTPQPVAPIELKPGAPFDFTPNVPGANNFAIRDGALPAGLTLDPATGRISGTPRESGPYSFSIIATPPANGVLLTFSGTIEAPNSTVVEPVVTPTLQTLDPITPSTSVLPQANQNLLVVSSASVGNTTVLPNTQNNGLIVTSSEVILSVAGIRANGNPLPLASGSQLTVQAGLKIEVSGSGFLPNSEVFVYMFSTPQLIGKVKTDANGNYSEQLTVPTSLSGNHVLQVNGYLKSNEVKSISLAVIVTKKETEKKPTTKPAATKDRKIKIPAKGVVVPFKGKGISLSAANLKLIKQLQMPANKSKQIYVLGYTSNTGVPRNDILVALNRAINVSKEIKRLNPKVKVGFAGLGTKTSPVCAKQKNICAVVTIR